MKRFYLRYRRYFLYLMLLLIFLLAWIIYQASKAVPTMEDEQPFPSVSEAKVLSTDTTAIVSRTMQATNNLAEEDSIQVDLKGEVKQPGIYQIAKTANLANLLALAGGLTDEAASDYLNLAMPLVDKQLYRIPSQAEIASLHKEAKLSCLKPGIINVLPSEYLQSLALKQTKATNSLALSAESNLVNINSCSQDEIAKVPHIGSKLAASIIAYRNEHGDFLNLEGLLQVKGIKTKKFKQIQKYLTCG